MKEIIWADGRPHRGIEIDFDYRDGLDYEAAACLLGCEVNQVNHCNLGEIDAYGITLETDIFLRPNGLA